MQVLNAGVVLITAAREAAASVQIEVTREHVQASFAKLDADLSILDQSIARATAEESCH